MVTSSSGSTRQPLVLTGLVSGFDTKGMIDQLTALQREPIKAVQDQISDRQLQIGAIKDINGRLNNLLTQAKKFVDAGFLQTKNASVAAGGSQATVAVSAGSSATVGTFKVTVNQLADATRVSSPNAIGQAIDAGALLKDAKLGTAVTLGAFTVNGVSISVDPTTDSLNAVMQRIRDNVPGVTVSLVADASGRNNLLRIEHASGVTLGAGADTSNFLSATKLLSSPAGTARTSTGNLGVVQTGNTLDNASLVTALSASSGSFKINGVEITWNSTRDSLSTVLGRINNSTAGVNATYDSATDKVTIANKKTGSTAISFQDVTGNFLDAIGVRTATQTTGKNAQFQIDTGNGNVTYYSTNNTVADTLPGVTITLLKESATADTVSVSQDTGAAVGRMREFVTQFNSTVDFINQKTDFNTTSGTNGPLAGDAGIQGIASSLRQMITAAIDGVSSGKKTLGELGVSFGPVGSKAGTANTLTLDEAKFRSALENDPAGVANVLSAFRATATLNGGGTGGVQGLSGDPTALRRPGKYTITTAVNGDGTANITATFKPTDGSASSTTTLSNVTAGSTTTGLIGGVTVTLKGTFTAGTDTVTIATPTRGISAKLEQYLDPLTRGDGTLQARQESENKEIGDLKKRVDLMNERLDNQRQFLQQKFARMEQAMARAQSQRSALSSLAAAAGG
jgi:flagellar hook-associated protein 2